MAGTAPQCPLSNASVLIVEDDPELRRMIALVLAGAGAAVEEAGSGGEGEQILGNRAIEIVLLDWNLLDMPATEFLDRAEQTRPGTTARCIVVTGDLIRRGELHEAERRGLPVLRKPFRPGELIDAVKRALRA